MSKSFPTFFEMPKILNPNRPQYFLHVNTIYNASTAQSAKDHDIGDDK